MTITPNPVQQGQDFYVSGSFNPQTTSELPYVILVYSGACRSGKQILFATGFVEPSGRLGPVKFSSTSLDVGTHCVEIDAGPDSATGSITVVPAAVPEYPTGLTILAILMILAYAVIKRRSRLA